MTCLTQHRKIVAWVEPDPSPVLGTYLPSAFFRGPLPQISLLPSLSPFCLFLHTLPLLWTLTFFLCPRVPLGFVAPTLAMAKPTLRAAPLFSFHKALLFPWSQTHVPYPPLLPCLPKRKCPDSSSLIMMMQEFIFQAAGGT